MIQKKLLSFLGPAFSVYPHPDCPSALKLQATFPPFLKPALAAHTQRTIKEKYFNTPSPLQQLICDPFSSPDQLKPSSFCMLRSPSGNKSGVTFFTEASLAELEVNESFSPLLKWPLMNMVRAMSHYVHSLPIYNEASLKFCARYHVYKASPGVETKTLINKNMIVVSGKKYVPPFTMALELSSGAHLETKIELTQYSEEVSKADDLYPYKILTYHGDLGLGFNNLEVLNTTTVQYTALTKPHQKYPPEFKEVLMLHVFVNMELLPCSYLES